MILLVSVRLLLAEYRANFVESSLNQWTTASDLLISAAPLEEKKKIISFFLIALFIYLSIYLSIIYMIYLIYLVSIT